MLAEVVEEDVAEGFHGVERVACEVEVAPVEPLDEVPVAFQDAPERARVAADVGACDCVGYRLSACRAHSCVATARGPGRVG